MSGSQEPISEETPSMANKRPSTLSELRKCIAHGLCDSESFKGSLKLAEQSRKEGKQYFDTDLERAFVAFARAGYLLLVKLPVHPYYKLLLSDDERRYMLQNGQGILRTLIVLKRRIVERQNEWAIMDAYPESPVLGTFPSLSASTSAGITPRMRGAFREKTDYRIEFDQLLGGKVEDTTAKLRQRNTPPPLISPARSSRPRHAPPLKDNDFVSFESIQLHPLQTLPGSPDPSCSVPMTPEESHKALGASSHHEPVSCDPEDIDLSWDEPPPFLNTTKKSMKRRQDDHYYQTLRSDPKSGNTNPINFEIKWKMKSRRQAHYVNSTSGSSNKFDSFWSSLTSNPVNSSGEGPSKVGIGACVTTTGTSD